MNGVGTTPGSTAGYTHTGAPASNDSSPPLTSHPGLDSGSSIPQYNPPNMYSSQGIVLPLIINTKICALYQSHGFYGYTGQS